MSTFSPGMKLHVKTRKTNNAVNKLLGTIVRIMLFFGWGFSSIVSMLKCLLYLTKISLAPSHNILQLTFKGLTHALSSNFTKKEMRNLRRKENVRFKKKKNRGNEKRKLG